MSMLFFAVKFNKLDIKLQTYGFKDCFKFIDNFGSEYQMDMQLARAMPGMHNFSGCSRFAYSALLFAMSGLFRGA